MARRTDQSIHLATTRQKLSPRREPYWRALSQGRHLGFRKSITGSETFIARWNDRNGKRHYQSLGPVTYAEAKDQAEAWFAECRAGITTAATVRVGLMAYVSNLRAENREEAAIDAEQRFFRDVFSTNLADTLLRDVTTYDIESWRDSLRIGRTAATVNRNLNCLKAGLNYAFKRGMVGTDRAWKVVGRLAVDSPARMQYLTLDQRRKLLRYCRDDLFLLVKALIYTGARPGEIARCRVEDFDPTTGALVLRSAKGSRKKIVERRFVLSGDGLKFFRQQHRLKTPRAFLFTTAGGSQWVKWLWSKPIRQAVAAADLPQGTTAYVIRHSVISDWIQGGIDVGTVAKSTGTSIQMINDYYFKSLPDAVAVELSRICVI